MVDYYTEQKEQIIREHTDNLIEANTKILELLGDTLKDKKTSIGLKMKLINFVRVSFLGERETSIRLNSEDRLQLSEGFFENAKLIMDAIKNDAGYVSLSKGIDEQLEIYRKEMETIHQELKNTQDPEQQEKLWGHWNRAKSMSAE